MNTASNSFDQLAHGHIAAHTDVGFRFDAHVENELNLLARISLAAYRPEWPYRSIPPSLGNSFEHRGLITMRVR